MAEKRIIKRYTNRKQYDKQESRYVTLEEIARLVREGEDVAVIDNETEEDLTAVTFAQIILEEEKRKTNFISVPFLRKLIRSGEARVQDFSEALGDLTLWAEQLVRRKRVVGYDQAAHPQDHRERGSAQAAQRLQDRQHPAEGRPDARTTHHRQVPRGIENPHIKSAEGALLAADA